MTNHVSHVMDSLILYSLVCIHNNTHRNIRVVKNGEGLASFIMWGRRGDRARSSIKVLHYWSELTFVWSAWLIKKSQPRQYVYLRLSNDIHKMMEIRPPVLYQLCFDINGKKEKKFGRPENEAMCQQKPQRSVPTLHIHNKNQGLGWVSTIM